MSADPDVLVVGGGPGGLAAAATAAGEGAHVTVVERDDRLGGILNQCIHDGFGLTFFGESLTGPEYAARLIAGIESLPIEILLDATVLSLEQDRACHVLSSRGYERLRPRSIVLAMGCRERSFASLGVPGPRPAGIYPAGTAQRLINLDGLTLGRRAVILGSGDIGLIMARRLVLEGAEVVCVVEQLPYAGGLARNVSQCLNDFAIPLVLKHTVTEITGDGRLTGVRIGPAHGCLEPDYTDERLVECDTLLVSVGLIPENELTAGAGGLLDPRSGGPVVSHRLETSLPGVFACGNVLHVNDLADWASLEGQRAGRWAAAYAEQPWRQQRRIDVRASDEFRYVVPQQLLPGEPVTLSLRAGRPHQRTRVVASRDGRAVATRDYAYLVPSELATLELPALDEPGGDVEVCLE